MNSLCTKQPLNKGHLCIKARTLLPKVSVIERFHCISLLFSDLPCCYINHMTLIAPPPPTGPLPALHTPHTLHTITPPPPTTFTPSHLPSTHFRCLVYPISRLSYLFFVPHLDGGSQRTTPPRSARLQRISLWQQDTHELKSQKPLAVIKLLIKMYKVSHACRH